MESMQKGAGVAVSVVLGVGAAFAAIAVIVLIAALCNVAHSAPPENADPAFIPWFQSLTSNSGGHCCGPETDCRPVAYRIAGDHYEALLDPAVHQSALQRAILEPRWIKIPPEVILDRHDNPTGRAVMCWRNNYGDEDPSAGVLCFVRPAET